MLLKSKVDKLTVLTVSGVKKDVDRVRAWGVTQIDAKDQRK